MYPLPTPTTKNSKRFFKQSHHYCLYILYYGHLHDLLLLYDASFVYDPKILQTFPKEVHHDVLYREGLTQKGEVTFTPRLVLLDLKGSLNSLPKEGKLYTTSSDEEIKWSGDVTLHKFTKAHKNEFLQNLDKAESQNGNKEDWKLENSRESARDVEEMEDDVKSGHVEEISDEDIFGPKFFNLDDEVTVWSDFLNVHLHPRTIQLLQDFAMDSEDQPFDVFGLGHQALTGEAWDEWENRVRFFTEECDLQQGFHLMFDSHNGFGGVTAKVLQYLKDEYPGKSSLTVALTPPSVPDQTPVQRANRIINSALSLGECFPSSSVYLPLSLATSLWRNLGAPQSFPHLTYNPQLDYHTSAILAVSLDTMTMPYRLENNFSHLSDITGCFSYLGKNVAALCTSLPIPILEFETFTDSLKSDCTQQMWQSLTPSVTCQVSPTFQSCILRGVQESVLKRDGSPSHSRQPVKDIVQEYLSNSYPHSLLESTILRDPLIVVTPFPHIFSPQVSQAGLISSTLRHPKCGVGSVPVMTSLQSTSDIGRYVSTLHSEAARFTIKKHHHFLEAGLEEEEYTETLHSLHNLAECYSLT